MSASIPLIELKSLIHDAFPGQDEARPGCGIGCGLSDEASSGARGGAGLLSAQPGDVVLSACSAPRRSWWTVRVFSPSPWT
ncbi:MAG: hypothetical protein IPN01_18515 [Deltaproteobacteria bacterium]|nr:hypothetical protein [Deltaproteobacteria bacterium]